MIYSIVHELKILGPNNEIISNSLKFVNDGICQNYHYISYDSLCLNSLSRFPLKNLKEHPHH